MLRRSSLSLIFVVALALMLATTVLAGGVVVTLDEMPSDVQAGVSFTASFMIFSAHDGLPESGRTPEITVHDVARGESLTFAAKAQGEAGHYIVTMILPMAGEWAWQIQPLKGMIDDYPPSIMTPIQVVQNTSLTQNNVLPQADRAVMPWLTWTAIIVLPLGATVVVVRMRRHADVGT